MDKKTKQYTALSLAAAAGMTSFFIWQSEGLMTSNLTIESARLPAAFDGYKLVQVSDFHNKSFGRDHRRILRRIAREKPDGILVTGDLINSYYLHMDAAIGFIREAVKLAPVYYVPGNHESRILEYISLRRRLSQMGVQVLENKTVRIDRGDASISCIGVVDPSFMADSDWEDDEEKMEKRLKRLVRPGDDSYKLLLSHRPELIDLYARFDLDLVFSGHAHGGQFRLPVVGAVFSPNQGLFPKYTSGAYRVDNTTMVVSRGIGNSVMPIRLFNRPEIVSVTLRKKTGKPAAADKE